MGNTTSEVASGVKAQINSGGQGPELYRFADLTVRQHAMVCEIGFFSRAVENSSMSCVWQIARKITHKSMR